MRRYGHDFVHKPKGANVKASYILAPLQVAGDFSPQGANQTRSGRLEHVGAKPPSVSPPPNMSSPRVSPPSEATLVPDERNRPAAQRLQSIEIYLLRCERGSVHR